jgi:DNA ligase (NAD+)
MHASKFRRRYNPLTPSENHMNDQTASKQIDRLRSEIRRHDDLYYQHAKPEISDQEYDALLRDLLTLEAKYPELVTPDSPSQRVGGNPIEGFTSVRHAVRMMSIDNTYDEEGVRDFDTRVRKLLGSNDFQYTCEPKIDGVSLSLRYENGLLVTAATRGNGVMGDDVTHNAKTIRNIPLRLQSQAKEGTVVEVRGEVFISRAQFAKINEAQEEAGLEAYANPRNTAAGTLKQLDPKIVASRKLEFLPHGAGELTGLLVPNYHGWQDLLKAMGFRTNEHFLCCTTIDGVLEYIHKFADTRKGLPYDTDGVVVKIDRFDQRDILGETAKAPRWCIAYKYQPEQGETELARVVFQVGKTGTITPVGEFEPPIFISGTNVYRASLHNFDEIDRKDIRLHDRVIVEKAGEVIPYVVGVVTDKRPANARKIARPEACPSCANKDLEHDGGFVRCMNPSCPAQLAERIRFWAGRNQMDINELGEKLIEKLLTRGYVKSIPDLYRLTHEQLVETLKKADAKGDSNPTKAASNVIEGIAQSKDRGLARVLAGLGILHVGTRTAQVIVNQFPTLEGLTAAKLEDILSIPDMGGGVVDDFKKCQDRYDCLAGLTLEQIFGFEKLPAGREKTIAAAEAKGREKTPAAAIEELKKRGVVAQSLYLFLHSDAGRATLNELKELGLKLHEDVVKRTGPQPLAGMSIVVTGTLSKFSRTDIKKKIEALGGKSVDSVSKNTTFVLAGEEAGSKLDKAKKLGIEVLDEPAFLKRIGEG